MSEPKVACNCWVVTKSVGVVVFSDGSAMPCSATYVAHTELHKRYTREQLFDWRHAMDWDNADRIGIDTRIMLCGAKHRQKFKDSDGIDRTRDLMYGRTDNKKDNGSISCEGCKLVLQTTTARIL